MVLREGPNLHEKGPEGGGEERGGEGRRQATIPAHRPATGESGGGIGCNTAAEGWARQAGGLGGAVGLAGCERVGARIRPPAGRGAATPRPRTHPAVDVAHDAGPGHGYQRLHAAAAK
jgi:hypothetical protein